MLDRTRSFASTFALALALAAALVLAARPAAAGDTPPTADHDAHHQQMAALHADLMAKLDAMDAKVDGLLAAMNAASGDAKVDAIAAVVTELAAQRKQLRDMVMQGIHAMHGEGGMGHGPGHDHAAMGDHGMAHGEGGDCCKEGASCCKEGADCCKGAASCCKPGADCCKEGASCCAGHGDCCSHAAGKDGECSAASTPLACAEGEAKADCCAKHEAGEAMACCAGKHHEGEAPASHPPGH